MTLSKTISYQTATWGGGNRRRPGDTLIYTITYTNSGSGSANQIVISDVSPANTDYLANTVEVNNSSTGSVFVSRLDDGSNSAPGNTVSVVGETVSVTIGTVGPQLMGDATYTGQFRFKVKIN